MRTTPFSLVFAELAAEQFPLIAEALRRDDVDPMQRDRFVLLEPVGRLLRSIVPDAAREEPNAVYFNEHGGRN